MGPARTSTRRNQQIQIASARSAAPESNTNVADEQLFLEPMMGTPLAIYVEKDVENRDVLVDIIVVSFCQILIWVSIVSIMHSHIELCFHCTLTRFLVYYGGHTDFSI